MDTAKRKMKYEDIQERRQRIMRFIQSNQVVSMTDVIDHVEASQSTVRRDIDWLEENQKIGRHHGSIYLANSQYDVFDIRSNRFRDEKHRIGEYAATLVNSGDVIYVGAGTTIRQFAMSLIARPNLKDVFVVTSAMNVAASIAADARFLVFVLPGILTSPDENLQATGRTFEALKEFNFNKSFTGASGIAPEKGVLMPAHHYAETTRVAYEQSSEVIVLADHSKFSIMNPYVVCGMDKVDRIICDQHPDVERLMEPCKEYMKLIDFV